MVSATTPQMGEMLKGCPNVRDDGLKNHWLRSVAQRGDLASQSKDNEGIAVESKVGRVSRQEDSGQLPGFHVG